MLPVSAVKPLATLVLLTRVPFSQDRVSVLPVTVV